MEKYGFVYIWYDRKHKRYYVGSHWGTEDDGYICSSSWMKASYKRRPHDFRRRIIARVTTSRQDLLLEENRWLQMIDDDELGSRFYNLYNNVRGHWSTNEYSKMTVGQKISARQVGRKLSEEHKNKIGNANRGRTLIHSEKARRKMSESHMGKPSSKGMLGKKHSEEWKIAHSERMKLRWSKKKE